MKKGITIYGLVDPRDSRVYYVGTTADFKLCLERHMNAGRYRGIQLVDDWIRELLDEGLDPWSVILEEANKDTRSERRRYWIGMMDRLNPGLLNLQYTANYKKTYSAECRAKMSATKILWWSDPDRRLQASERSKRLWKDPRHRELCLEGTRRHWDRKLGVFYDEE